jgi:hypothetical protein
MSDTPRTDRAANESIVSVYETSKQLERELARAKALAESNGKLAHDRGIELMQSKEANAGLMKACKHLESKMENLRRIYKTKHKNKP